MNRVSTYLLTAVVGIALSAACAQMPDTASDSPHGSATSALNRTAGPAVSIETTVDSTNVSGYATQRIPGQYTPPSVATDGTNFFTAWVDRSGVTPVVMGALVSSAGTILSPEPIRFGSIYDAGPAAFGASYQVLVSAGPGGYLVVWPSRLSLSGISPLRAARVTSDGKQVDADPLDLGEDYFSGTGASADSFFYTALESSTSGVSVKVTRVAATTVADPGIKKYSQKLTIEAGKYVSQTFLAGDVFFFTLTGTSGYVTDLYSMKLGASGALSPPVSIAPFPATYWPDGIAYTGSKFLLMASGHFGSDPVRVREVGADGVTLGATASLPFDTFRRLYADSNGFVVHTWDGNAYRECPYNLNLTPAAPCYNFAEVGFVLGATRLVIPRLSSSLPTRGPLPSLQFFDRTTGAPRTPNEVFMTHTGSSQVSPSVAYDPGTANYLTAWIDDADGDSPVVPTGAGAGTGGLRIKAAAVREKGDTFETDPAFFISPAGAQSISDPHLILDKDRFVATWSEDRVIAGTLQHRVVASTITLSGTPATPTVAAPVVIWSSDSVAPRAPKVAADRSGYTFAWTENSGGGARVLTKRWNAVDAAPDSSFPNIVSKEVPNRARDEVVSIFDGKATLVAWTDSNIFSTRIYGVTFADGASIPSSPAYEIDTTFSSKQHLRATTDSATSTLLVWDDANTLNLRDIRGKLLSIGDFKTKDVFSSFAIAASIADDEVTPGVAYSNDGESYAVVWSRRTTTGDWDLANTWVATDGRVLDPAPGRTVSATTADAVAAANGTPEARTAGEDEATPSLAIGNASTTGVTYVRFDSRPGYRSVRARFRTLYSGRKSGETCAASEECASRYCVDGICCKTACNDGCGQCAGDNGGVKGVCSPRNAERTCGTADRYKCNGASVSCPTECENASVCAPSFSCIDHQCSTFSTVCVDDLTTMTQAGPETCGAYRCSNGACNSTCNSIDDCSPGNICDFTNRCTSAPPVVPPSCAMGTSNVSGWFALTALPLFLIARRRRRPLQP